MLPEWGTISDFRTTTWLVNLQFLWWLFVFVLGISFTFAGLKKNFFPLQHRTTFDVANAFICMLIDTTGSESAPSLPHTPRHVNYLLGKILRNHLFHHQDIPTPYAENIHLHATHNALLLLKNKEKYNHLFPMRSRRHLYQQRCEGLHRSAQRPTDTSNLWQLFGSWDLTWQKNEINIYPILKLFPEW